MHEALSDAVVHEPSLASRIDPVAVDELLLAQKLQAAGGGKPITPLATRATCGQQCEAAHRASPTSTANLFALPR